MSCGRSSAAEDEQVVAVAAQFQRGNATCIYIYTQVTCLARYK